MTPMTRVLHAAWPLAAIGAAVLAFRAARQRGPADARERGARPSAPAVADALSGR